MSARVVNEIFEAERKPAFANGPAAEDAALVLAAKNGDARAFEILVTRHRGRILALAMRFTRIREDAEDILQQSFQKAFIHLRKFEEKSSFSTWLTRIAINEALMLLRRRRGLREVAIDDSGGSEEPGLELEVPDSAPDPEASYLQGEEARILSGAIHKLRPGVRKAMELRELAELSTKETAWRMGLSVATIKARLFHGRRQLRKALTRYMRAPHMPGNDISRIPDEARAPRKNRLSCAPCC